jgi:hypothetical protein
MTFRYTDPGGIVLTVEPSNTIDGACRVELEDPDGGTYTGDGARICAIVPPLGAEDTAAGIAAAISKAAGLPEPLILRHPAATADAITEVTARVDVGRSKDLELPVTLAIRGVSVLLTPSGARSVAAHLAARAAEAEGDPELAALQNLGRLISEYGANEACGRAAARAILARWRLEERAA